MNQYYKVKIVSQKIIILAFFVSFIILESNNNTDGIC